MLKEVKSLLGVDEWREDCCDMCWRSKCRKSESVDVITQSESPIATQKLKTNELTSVAAVAKKDADESPPVKVVEFKNKESSKANRKAKSVLSELNTLKDVSHSMPIVDVQHDETKNDKFFASAELL